MNAPVEFSDSGAATTNERVLGWDLLRGLCAVAVAAYHYLYFTKLAQVHTWGSYGVFLFFVLSGASLAYTYAGRIQAGQFSFPEFLFVRFWRLAPLYVALMLMVVPTMAIWYGDLWRLIYTLLLNLTFLMGLYQPISLSLLTGGWSLGVEAVFYLLFPLLIWSFRSWRAALGVFALLLVLQVAWISATVGATVVPEQTWAYYNAPAFGAYFMGGCVIGVLQRKARDPAGLSWGTGVALIVAGFATMVAVNPAEAAQELLGWRAVLLGTLCFFMVAAAGRMSLPPLGARLARRLGDATYGMYLIHPVLYFYLVPGLGLHAFKSGTVAQRLGLTAALMCASFALALLSEYFFERPVRQWSRRVWARRAGLRLSAAHNRSSTP
ncbi:MAG: acyltransferase [Bdellovibrionales bacterium]|nr:acyltransferase [Ramlibacter sp.]